MDTNVIIDGRIYDVAKTGFLDGQLYVPGFVIDELQYIADSHDQLRRQRGRRGLEVLKHMRADFPLETHIHDKLAPDLQDGVRHARLVRLAKALGADMLTNDFNLKRVAELQDVRVMSLNDLALSLRPNVLPLETLGALKIIKEGNQIGQGVGYLEDGTMVVVENGQDHIGETMGRYGDSGYPNRTRKDDLCGSRRPRSWKSPSSAASLGMKIAAAILAAGSSSRAGFDKTWADLAGRPVWKWSFDTYSACPAIDDVFMVASAGNAERFRKEGTPVFLGGSSRQESARLALQAAEADVLLLHDAARPFVSIRLIQDVVSAILHSGAAAAGVPVADTIKETGPDGLRTLDRSRLIAMQTPQGALVDLLLKAHSSATADATDDAALLEQIGVQPEIVPGDPQNFKITTPEDMERARAFAGGVDTDSRVGFGYDVHPFSTEVGRPLMLGGVLFPGHPALDGHSDADVLLHAATDALLGAAGMGDIGRHFPNDDPRWKNAPSMTFLRTAAALLKESRWTLSNLDVTLIAETPKISPRAQEMVNLIADALWGFSRPV